MSLSQPQNNGKQDGYSAENALQRGFSAGLFQHIKAIRISDWHFKGVSRQNFFQNLKATRPRKARTKSTMPLALSRANPCYPDTILSFDVAPAITLWSHLHPSM
ncbi:MAG: hypothetical protein D8B50_01515 [Prevotella sp.]|nr:MAG: hypothetical protein D8B50_01515 [Prevotella sp.]